MDGPRPNYPVVGYVGDEHEPDTWTAEGEMFVGMDKVLIPSERLDLVPVPTKHEGWGIIIKSGSESVDIAGQINVWLTSSREDTEYKIRQQPEKNWHLAHVTWED